ncbi:hypothetical protein EMIT0P43_40500 [Pseudomonas jessenii]
MEMNNNPQHRLCSGPALLFMAAGSMWALELENSHENRDRPRFVQGQPQRPRRGRCHCIGIGAGLA